MLVPEFVTLSGDVGRMNTVFKFHFGAFWLWATASALVLAGRDGLLPPGRAWRAAVAVVLAVSLCYPPFSALGRIWGRVPADGPITLDGLQAMEDVEFEQGGRRLKLVGDRGAIQWLMKETEGAAVMVEAVTDDYGPGGRISSATGIPTLLGWPLHQMQHRRGQNLAGEVGRRREAVREIYRASMTEEVLDAILRYRVDIVIFGELERAVYGGRGEEKFQLQPQFWEFAHSSGETRIYRFRYPGSSR